MDKKDHEFCLRCGRKLKNPKAREIGYGVVCERKVVRVAQDQNRLFGVDADRRAQVTRL